MSNISNSFLSNVNQLIGHGDRANKFRISINTPMFLISDDLPKNYTYICKSTTLPSKEIGTTEVWHKGRNFVLRDTTTFSNRWSATFYNDENYNVRKFFESWMFQIDRYTSVIARSILPISNMYSGNITISKLNERQKVVIDYELFHAFPISLGEVQLSKENSQVTEFTVEFAYSYWDRSKESPWGYL